MTQPIQRYSRHATNPNPKYMQINKHIDSYFIHALGVEVTDKRWKHLMYDWYS